MSARRDGYRMSISNCDRDDFLNYQTTIRVERFDGQHVKWTLPDRLVKDDYVLQKAIEYMAFELEERHPL
jgi:hypothetical protein